MATKICSTCGSKIRAPKVPKIPKPILTEEEKVERLKAQRRAASKRWKEKNKDKWNAYKRGLYNKNKIKNATIEETAT